MGSELRKYNGSKQLGEWSEMVQACRGSGMSVAQWCGQSGIPESTYYVRRRKVYAAMREETAQRGFYELKPEQAEEAVQTAARSASGAQYAAAMLRFAGIAAEVYPSADERTIAAIVHALRSC